MNPQLPADCRPPGSHAGRLLDSLHFVNAGAVSFARGLNDTPKSAVLLLAVGALLGMGIVTNQTRWQPALRVLASWVITLPRVATLTALAYRFISSF